MSAARRGLCGTWMLPQPAVSKAILFFSTANDSTGVVYPSRVGPLVRAVKNHPALYGYLSVKEPSWVRITGS